MEVISGFRISFVALGIAVLFQLSGCFAQGLSI